MKNSSFFSFFSQTRPEFPVPQLTISQSCRKNPDSATPIRVYTLKSRIWLRGGFSVAMFLRGQTFWKKCERFHEGNFAKVTFQRGQSWSKNYPKGINFRGGIFSQLFGVQVVLLLLKCLYSHVYCSGVKIFTRNTFKFVRCNCSKSTK